MTEKDPRQEVKTQQGKNSKKLREYPHTYIDKGRSVENVKRTKEK